MAAKGTVCIIDPDRDLHGILAATFALEGFRVVSSSRARDAIKKIDLQRFAAIFIDPGTPADRLDDVFKSVRQAGGLNQKTPLVVMGHSTESEVPTDAVPTLSAVVAKPFTIDEIVAVLRRVTG
jgi:DNA-binding NtrC family response regulator